jgi:hypothetical protein
MIYPWAHSWETSPLGHKCARCGGSVGTMRAAYFAPWKSELWMPVCSSCLHALMCGTPCPPTLDDAGRGIVAMTDVETTETGALVGTGEGE